jgi:hypothetical protein
MSEINSQNLSFAAEARYPYYVVMSVSSSGGAQAGGNGAAGPGKVSLGGVQLFMPPLQSVHGMAYEPFEWGGVFGSMFNDAMQGEKLSLENAAGKMKKLFGNAAQYGKQAATDTAAGAAAGAMAGGGASGNVAGAVASKITGKLVNPRQEQIFRAVHFREFNFSYQFVMKSAADGAAMQSIIKKLKYHMHPELVDGGAYMKLPDEFDLKFMGPTGEIGFVNKIQTCVLSDMTVDYGPQGQWLAIRGTDIPVFVNMTLTFKELKPLDKALVEAGY